MDNSPPRLVAIFARHPVVMSITVSVLFFTWILVGTVLVDPITDGATNETLGFVRDGLVRWPAALLCLGLLLLVRRAWPLDLLRGPQAPLWFPWATILLAVAALIRVSAVSQFVDDGAYTAAVFFSELSTGVVEELVFRGLVFGGLVLGLGRSQRSVRNALLLTTVLFGVAHAFGGWLAVVVTLLFGAVFMMSTLEMRSIWPAAILHGLFDVGVNGAALAPDPAAEDWQLTLMGIASLALFLAGIAAMVMFVFWREWPALPESQAEELAPG